MREEDIFKLIVKNLCDVIPELNPHELTPRDSLKGLGANSLDRAEIVMLTLDALALRIPLVETSGPTNIGELSRLLYGKLQNN